MIKRRLRTEYAAGNTAYRLQFNLSAKIFLKGFIATVPAMTIVAVIFLVWVLAFAVFLLPARMIGNWLVRSTPPTAGRIGMIINLCCCFMMAKLVVVIGCVVLVFARLESLPHVNQDPHFFGLIFVGLHLFVPAFGALLVGYFRAARQHDAVIGHGTPPTIAS